MAHVQNRKGNFYSQKQSVRDELSAPQHLESAGDALIKNLARKQTNTSTSLQEQLEIVQNFQKGFQLNPDNRKGVTSLEEFQKHTLTQSDTDAPTDSQPTPSLDELMKETGLTRHELELGLCEKPNSTISQLYMFAIKNQKRAAQPDSSEPKEHPINRLKEIEEECFGESKKAKIEPEDVQKAHKRKKHRKRKRKGAAGGSGESAPKEEPQKSPSPSQDSPKSVVPRPSLWDVKDMKKWAECKKVGCKPPALYAIKNGEIIKLGEGSETEGGVT